MADVSRPTAELAEYLRVVADVQAPYLAWYDQMTLREAADRLATLQAIIDGCPRCSARASLRAEDL